MHIHPMNVVAVHGSQIMTIKDLEDVWINKTHESINNINKMLERTQDYEQEFVELARFILTTDINPYQFLPRGWENCLYSAQSTEGLLHTIHHALVDDGDLIWVDVELHGPHLAFNDYWDTERIQQSVEQRFAGLSHTHHMNYKAHRYSSEFIHALVKHEADWRKRVEKLEENWARR